MMPISAVGANCCQLIKVKAALAGPASGEDTINSTLGFSTVPEFATNHKAVPVEFQRGRVIISGLYMFSAKMETLCEEVSYCHISDKCFSGSTMLSRKYISFVPVGLRYKLRGLIRSVWVAIGFVSLVLGQYRTKETFSVVAEFFLVGELGFGSSRAV